MANYVSRSLIWDRWGNARHGGTLQPALETYALNATDFLLPPTKGIERDFIPHFLQVARQSAAAQPRSDGSVARLSCFWASSTRGFFHERRIHVPSVWSVAAINPGRRRPGGDSLHGLGKKGGSVNRGHRFLG